MDPRMLVVMEKEETGPLSHRHSWTTLADEHLNKLDNKPLLLTAIVVAVVHLLIGLLGKYCNTINKRLISTMPALMFLSTCILRRACENGEVLCYELPNAILLLVIFSRQESGILHVKRPDRLDLLVVLDLAFDHGCGFGLSCQDFWNHTIEDAKNLECQVTRDFICYDQVVECFQ